MLGNAGKFSWLGTTLLLCSIFFSATVVANKGTDSGSEEAENASNPLAAVDNTVKQRPILTSKQRAILTRL